MKDETFPDNRSGVRGNQGKGSRDERQEYQSSASGPDAVVRRKKSERDRGNTGSAPDQCKWHVSAVSGAGIRGVCPKQVRIPLSAVEQGARGGSP